MKRENGHFVRALSRGISILEAFDEANPELGIGELARKTNLSKTTVFRLARTMVDLGYMAFSTRKGRYRLGSRVYSFCFTVLRTMDLKTIASPYLQSLSDQCGETVNMAVLEGDELVYIERIKTRQIVNINLHVGSRLPLYNTGMGRALLSAQSDAWIKDYIKRMKKIPEAESFIGPKGEVLKKIIESVRINHYAVNDEDLVKGLRSIASPIRDGEGKIIAAINIAVPSARVKSNNLKSVYAPLLLKAAQTISEELGYRGDDAVFKLKT